MEPTTQQLVEGTKAFLARVNLAGGEVPSFNLIMGWLDQLAAPQEASPES